MKVAAEEEKKKGSSFSAKSKRITKTPVPAQQSKPSQQQSEPQESFDQLIKNESEDSVSDQQIPCLPAPGFLQTALAAPYRAFDKLNLTCI